MLGPEIVFCPNLASRISFDLGDEGLSYWKKLEGTQTSKSHSESTTTRCYANDAGHGNLITYQVDISRTCSHVGPPLKEISNIIAAGA
jgi:hypothetical protein